MMLVSGGLSLAAAMSVALPRAAHADPITPPPVPPNIQVAEGHRASFVGHAFGTQNYICLPSSTSPTGFAWTLFGPQANLFNDAGRQVMTHFSSANAEEVDDPVRPVWQHSKDTSAVWGKMVLNGSVAVPGAIPWLLIEVVRDDEGATGGSKMTVTTFIQRLNTIGGTAPATGCAGYGDIGQRKYVPYEADYFFYKAEGSESDETDEF
jgi:hypothetical protein